MTRKTSLLSGAAFGVALAVMAVSGANAAPSSTAAENETLKEQVRELTAAVQSLEAWRDSEAANQSQTQAQMDQLKAQLADSQARAQAAEEQVQTQIQTIPGAVQTAVAANKPKSDALYIKGVKVTVGGFTALESVYRDHAEEADMASSYTAIPNPNVGLGHTQEFRFSARQSRLSVLAQGDASPTVHIAGYGEFDFLGAAQTANSNQTNSYTPRIRNIYGTVDWDLENGGLQLLAGQNWSLATMNSKGITPRNEAPPTTIEAQYVPGFVFARQPQVRLTYNWNKKVWVAVSLENPQTTFGGSTGVLPGIVVTSTGAAGSGFNSANTLSLNKLPDLIGKAAYEDSFDGHTVHAEVFGISRQFYDRVSVTTAGVANIGNRTQEGGGIGGGLSVGIIPKWLDAQVSGLWGSGIGRYGAGALPDVSFDPYGNIKTIKEWDLMAGGTLHVTKQLDLYVYGGEENESPNAETINGVTAGLGSPSLNDSGCFIENGTCANQTHYIQQVTVGFWDRPYSGPFGRFQWGVQYSNTNRYGFDGFGGGATAGVTSKATENMVYTSFRYYPF